MSWDFFTVVILKQASSRMGVVTTARSVFPAFRSASVLGVVPLVSFKRTLGYSR